MLIISKISSQQLSIISEKVELELLQPMSLESKNSKYLSKSLSNFNSYIELQSRGVLGFGGFGVLG